MPDKRATHQPLVQPFLNQTQFIIGKSEPYQKFVFHISKFPDDPHGWLFSEGEIFVKTQNNFVYWWQIYIYLTQNLF